MSVGTIQGLNRALREVGITDATILIDDTVYFAAIVIVPARLVELTKHILEQCLPAGVAHHVFARETLVSNMAGTP